jgi:hypothetical protein
MFVEISKASDLTLNPSPKEEGSSTQPSLFEILQPFFEDPEC